MDVAGSVVFVLKMSDVISGSVSVLHSVMGCLVVTMAVAGSVVHVLTHLIAQVVSVSARQVATLLNVETMAAVEAAVNAMKDLTALMELARLSVFLNAMVLPAVQTNVVVPVAYVQMVSHV